AVVGVLYAHCLRVVWWPAAWLAAARTGNCPISVKLAKLSVRGRAMMTAPSLAGVTAPVSAGRQAPRPSRVRGCMVASMLEIMFSTAGTSSPLAQGPLGHG